MHRSSDIVDFARPKFVHNFRRKIDYRCTNRDKIDVQKMPKSIQNRVAARPLVFSVRPGAFDIVAFGRSKFVHNFRQKIDPTPFPQNPPLSLPLPFPPHPLPRVPIPSPRTAPRPQKSTTHPTPCSPKSSPFGPVRPARARSSHASRCTNPDFGASEAAPGTVRGCYIVLHGAFDIVAFARSKFVCNLN